MTLDLRAQCPHDDPHLQPLFVVLGLRSGTLQAPFSHVDGIRGRLGYSKDFRCIDVLIMDRLTPVAGSAE